MATPIIVGVGDYINRSKKAYDAMEPLQLMFRAVTNALQDTGLSSDKIKSLQSQIDSIDVVKTWTWPYPDLPGSLATKLNANPKRKFYSDHGGNQPAKLFDEAARRVSRGESEVCVVTGGEALASLSACAAAKQLPPPGWEPLPKGTSVNEVFSPTTAGLQQNLGSKHGVGNPIHVYPLYEAGLRAHRGQSLKANNDESAELYAEFADVAAGNEFAWTYGGERETRESIGEVGGRNRMICSPYPLLMNAFNNINLAGACIVTSTAGARELGVPESKWIYALGGAGTQDADYFWHRPDFHSSPAICRSLDAGLLVSGLSKDDIDLFDFYSCFPIVPKLACRHLGLPMTGGEKPITLLGGLTSFGGAGNNYSMHAITELVRQLRGGKGENGLILANGGVVTYQHVICLSTQPRRDKYPTQDGLPAKITDIPVPPIQEEAEGDALIETYTVEFKRDGSPKQAYIVGRLKESGHRFLANPKDQKSLKAFCSDEEQIGRPGRVSTEKGGRNVFAFDEGSRL
ncbi:hypothetical protein MBLNU230_g5092t1 [Neophaeotheca triangularis]